jgi:hypothetical protein
MGTGFLSQAFGGFSGQNVFSSQFRESENNAGIAKNSFRPQSIGGFLQGCEIFGTHFNVDLDSTLPSSFHLAYRYVSLLR